MSRQTNQSPELPWDKRPLSVRDLAITVGVLIFACIASVALLAFALRNQMSNVSATSQTAAETTSSSSQSVAQGAAGPGQAIFEEKCVICHTIGAGVLVGPDLEGVTERRDRAWLARWIAEPDKMLAEGDPIATQLLQEFNNVPMINSQLSPTQVEDVLAYLENPGGPVSVTAVVLPEGDPARGEALFIGATTLANGAPPCISCHSTTGVGPLGGGTLGPDLTNVHARYGEAGLPTTLQSLPFPTMQGVFGARPLTDNEVADLFAYFTQTNQATAQAINYTFVIIGLLGFFILMLLSQLFWRKRLKAVRKPLLGGAK